MSFLKTAISVVLFVGLALFYYFYEHKGAPKRAEEKQRSERIFQFDRDRIETISIQRGPTVIRLEKRNGLWSMTQPVESETDSSIVESILKNMHETAQGRIVSDDPETPLEFGISEDSLVVTVEGDEETERFSLHLGAETPSGNNRFARRGSEGPIFLISLSASDPLDKRTFDIRDKTVVKGKTSDLNRIELDRGEFHLAAEKTGEDQWMITKPEKVRGDRTTLENIGSQMFNSKVKEFVDENPDDLSEYGLDNPAVALRFWTTGDDRPQTLYFGSIDEATNRVMVRREYANRVMAIAPTVLEDLKTDVNVYRDRTLLPFESEQVEKVEYSNSGEEILVHRKGEEQWNIIRPALLAADRTEVDSLLRDLGWVKIKTFVEKKAEDPSPYGLDSPQISIQIHEKGGSALPRVLISKGKDDAKFYATLGDKEEVFEVEERSFENMDKTLFDLRDKHLFRAKGDSFESIQIVRSETTIELVKPDDEWEFVGPVSGNPDTGKASNLVWTLAGLQFQEVVAEPATDFSEFGFDTPNARITVGAKDRGLLDEVVIGKKEPEGDRNYVRWSNGKGVYLIEGAFLDRRLPKDVADLK